MVLRTIIATLILMGLTIGFIYLSVPSEKNAHNQSSEAQSIEASEAAKADEMKGESLLGEGQAETPKPLTDIKPVKSTRLDKAKLKAEKAKKSAASKSEAARKKAQKIREQKLVKAAKQAERDKEKQAEITAAEAASEVLPESGPDVLGQDDVKSAPVEALSKTELDESRRAREGALTLFRQGLTEAKKIDAASQRDRSYLRLVDFSISNKLFGAARGVVSKISTANLRDQARTKIADALARKGKTAKALEILDQLENKDQIDAIKTDVKNTKIDIEVDRLPRK